MTTAENVTTLPQLKPSRLVAAEIRAELGRLGLNQTELARRMHVTQAWLSRRIGTTPGSDVEITFEEALAMGEALGITPQRLVSLLLPRLDSNQQPSG